jgi:peptidoglycan/LPS O-acetylase OafA/YrhL
VGDAHVSDTEGEGVTETRRFAYQPALDGLRALAVGSVIAYHLDSGVAHGGFLGVDTFFVLSGFLITSLLIGEWGQSRTINFAKFWLRRARRLLPALLLVLFAVAIYAAVGAPATQLSQIRGDGLATLFYGANWRFIASGQSYFTLFTDASPLRHMWSLAIEEQFYLVWPLIAFACLWLARGRQWLLGAVCVVGTVASAITMASLYQRADPSRAYYGTDSRAQLLLVGCLLALVLARWAPATARARTAVSVAGFVGIAYCLWAWAQITDTAPWMYRGGYLLFGLAVAAVITSAIQPGRFPVRAALSTRPLVWVGRISYGLYLWHWPVIVICSPDRTGLDGWQLTVVRLALTFGIATLSYYLVELPIREGRLFRRRFGVAIPTAFVGAGVAVMVATAAAVPLPTYLQGATRVVKAAGETTRPPAPTPTAATPGGGVARLPRRLLLVGDSLAVSLLPGLEQATAPAGVELSSRAVAGCGLMAGIPLDPKEQPYPWSEACDTNMPRIEAAAVRETQPDVVMWLSGAWDERDRVVGGKTVKLGSARGDRVVTQLIDQAAQRLTASGARLVIVTIAPDAPGTQLAADPRRNQRLAALNRLLRKYAAAHHIPIADLRSIVCPRTSGGKPCPRIVHGILLRPDGYHFDPNASRFVAERLLPRVLGPVASAISTTASPASGKK